MKQIYRKDLHTQDIRTEEYWNRFRIYAVLNQEENSTRFKNREIVYQILHTKNTTLDILKASKIKEYSHNSLRDLNCMTYIVENLPIYTFLKYLSQYSKSFLKLSDWKYVQRDTTYFVRIPTQVCKNIDIRKEYERIQLLSISNYRDLYKKGDIYGKEISKNLLPLGVQHRAVISTNLKENIDITNSLLCSDMVVDNQLGDMFERILKPDIEILPDCKQRATIDRILEYLKNLVSGDQKFNIDYENLFKFEYVVDIVEDMISNFEVLINPLGSKDELEFDYEDQVNIGNLIKISDLGKISSSKGSHIKGFLSIIDILEIQNYGYEMYIPLLSDFIDIDKELDRRNLDCFLLPKSSEEHPEIKREINKRLTDIYTEIKEWRKKSLEYMSLEMSNEFTKYLLPLAHMTKFNLFLDMNDIFNIRNIEFEYKEDFQKLFFQKDPLFKK